MTQPPPVDPLDDADFTDEDDELIAPAPRTPTSVEPIRVVLREQEAGERLDRVLAEREEIGHSRAVL